jgi:membrane protein
VSGRGSRHVQGPPSGHVHRIAAGTVPEDRHARVRWFAWPSRATMPWGTFLREIGKRTWDHDIFDVAAACSFWILFALFPFLFFAISILTLAFGHDAIQAVVGIVTFLAPSTVQSDVQRYVNAVLAGPSGQAAAIALGVALWTSSGGAMSVGDALNRAYGVRQDDRGYWVRRLESALVVVFSAVFLLVATAVFAFAPGLVDRLLHAMHLETFAGTAWRVLRWPVGLGFALLAWALAYWALPCKTSPLRLVTPGSLVGIPLWILASFGFSFYVRHFANYGVAYGSLAGAIVLVFWVYLSTLVLLVGGELNALSHELRERHER